METDEEPTSTQPKDIKRVAKDTVHKICSSQVILSLAVAVKELVENSVDAGAKVIEIKIKNYGEAGFDVIDNGSGIEESNFAGITAKHHTSKLTHFSDLERIKTFGFRGEALSSLCALSNVSITTRHSTTEHGTKLTLEHDGTIKKKSICARNVGTTVSVSDFFITLPVRRGEFIKNYKKDFSKMVQLIQEYCLCLTGVKILCSNQPASGPRQTVLSTNGTSVIENIVSIFGAKQAKELIRIKSPTEDGTEDGRYTQSIADLDTSNSILDVKQTELDNLNISRFQIEGFISGIDLHCARKSKDRQYFYINSRPVELKVISKLVNDVYHRYNLKEYPFVYLNLKMDQAQVDVNFSKDKRQVAVCNDTILSLAVKRSLLNTYGELPTRFKMVSVNSSVRKYHQEESDDEDEEDKILSLEPGNRFTESLKQWRITQNDPTPRPESLTQSNKRKPNCQPKNQKAPKIPMFFHQKIKEIEDRNLNASNLNARNDENSAPAEEDVTTKIDCKTRKSENTLQFEKVDDHVEKEKTSHEIAGPAEVIIYYNEEDSSTTQPLEQTFLQLKEPSTKPDETEESDLSFSQSPFNTQSDEEVIFIDAKKPDLLKHSSTVKVSLETIATMAKAEEEAHERLQKEKKSRKLKLRFKESIDPSNNKKAEAELETEIKKDAFKEMEVLGQFNLGFIIAKLNSDLIIVDQHASDEKFNFEALEKTTKLHSQQLVHPEKLELTAIQEITLIENLHVFAMNGFKFLIDETAPAGNKIKIHSKPHSKSVEFGKEDIEEMIFMLEDAPNTVCRPSRIRKMMASRACRKSIMIGDSLTKKQMKKVLEHMGELDHPWNCPHGRPTLRYLQNLDFIDDDT